MRRFQPGVFNSFHASRRRLYRGYGISSLPYGYGSYSMPYGGYGLMYSGGYGSGGYGSYSTPSGGYGGYDSLYSGDYGSSSTASSAPAQASQSSGASKATVEVSGPLKTPPPGRALIRLRLPQFWADVSIDGKKVDSVGKVRNYVTPELSAAKTFEVTATWKHNDRTSRLQEQVKVEAGQIRTLDFTSGN